MKLENKINWFEEFSTHKQELITRSLENSLKYLTDARTPGKGWGPFPQSQSELFYSALAIKALAKCDISARGMIADVSSYFRIINTEKLADLSLDELCNLLIIIKEEGKPNETYLQEIIAQIQTVITGMGSGFTNKNVCSVLLSLLETPDSDKLPFVKACADELIGQQTLDGGWPAFKGQEPSHVATALSVRTLCLLKGDIYLESLSRGLNFLREELSKKGWDELGMKGDTYTQAIVLWALADSLNIKYPWLRQGIDILYKKMNDDGSWGTETGEIGNVELTAICLLALTSAGETKFIPERLATSAIIDLSDKLTRLEKNKKDLVLDFERKLKDDCGNVVKERDELLIKVEKLSNRMLQLDSNIKEIKKSSKIKEIKYFEKELELQQQKIKELQVLGPLKTKRTLQYEMFFAFTIFITMLLMISLLVGGRIQVSDLTRNILLICIVMSLSTLSINFLRDTSLLDTFQKIFLNTLLSEKKKKEKGIELEVDEDFHISDINLDMRREEKYTSTIEILRRAYYSMSVEWDRNVREEVTYRLYKDFIDVPTEIGTRYLEELNYRLPLDREQRFQLQKWLFAVLELNPNERRILFIQIIEQTR